MKKIRSVLVAVLILITAVMPGCFAASAGRVSVGSAAASPGQSITVDVSVSGNPGIIAMRLLISYDKTKLRLDSAADTGLFGTGTALFGNNYAANPFVLMWDDSLRTADYTANGVAARLTFTVLPGASAGNTNISVSVDSGSTFNAALAKVPFTTGAGTVQITGSTGGTLMISAPDLSANKGDIVSVPVSVSVNPGIIGLQLSVSYDKSRLTLLGAEDSGLFGSAAAVFGNNLSASPYILSWEDGLAASDHTEVGELCVLRFAVKSSAPTGTAEITISCASGGAYNYSLNRVSTLIHSPGISVTGKSGNSNNHYSLAQILDWIITKIFNNTLGKIFGVQYPSKFGFV